VTWVAVAYRVAPQLAQDLTVVCPDLRGYGQSSKPPDGPDHAGYSKRAMADDCVALMKALGHDRFAVVGHDRGALVALRLAMDHPATVTRLGYLGAVPVGEALARISVKFATDWWHWFFFAQLDEPERMICADPDAFYRLDRIAESMGRENFEDFREAVHDPATVHAMLEDYRAGLGVDRAHDDADRATGRTVACPTLVLWGARDDAEDIFPDIAGIWRTLAPDLRAEPFDSGHHMAEENPDELVRVLRSFLAGTPA
jgi:haloacetate dehalogenase